MNPKFAPSESSDSSTQQQDFNRFARFYDDDYRNYREDIDFILDFASESGGPILELGCGTGRVLAPVSTLGLETVGVDISPALLTIAQQKLAQSQSEQNVRLIEDDIRSFRLPNSRFSFAYCVSNTLMHCTTQTDQIKVLNSAYNHLASTGILLIDLFNPDLVSLSEVEGLCELADSWQDARGNQVFKWSIRNVDAASQLQETLFIYEEIDTNGSSKKTSCPFLLRYVWPDEGKLMLETVGFEVLSVWGDFYGSEHDSGSERLIFLAKKP